METDFSSNLLDPLTAAQTELGGASMLGVMFSQSIISILSLLAKDLRLVLNSITVYARLKELEYSRAKSELKMG